MRFDDIQSFDGGGDVQPMQFDDIQPEEAPNEGPVQFAQIQPQSTQPANPPVEQPQVGPIGAAVAGAAPAAAPITAAIAAGARTMAATSEFGPWVSIPASLGAGLIASGVVGKIQDWLRDQYGPPAGPLSKPYEAAAADQQPLAYNVGRVAPIAAGMTTGNVTPLVRAASAGLMGSVDVLQQGIEKGFGNINPTEALIQAGAGAVLPQAREWAGGARPNLATAKVPQGAGEGPTPQGVPPGAANSPTSEQLGRDNVGNVETPTKATERDAQKSLGAPVTTSPAVGTAFEQPRSTQLSAVSENTITPAETISVVQSNRQGLKAGNQMGEVGVEGAPSTVIDTAPIPADVAAAIGPEPVPSQPVASASPAEAPRPGPASTQGAQAPLPPVAPVMGARPVPSAPPVPTPAEVGLEGAQVPPQPAAQRPLEEGPTPTGLEGQVPNAQQLIEKAFNAATSRPIIRQPMPSIANSSKNPAGPVVVDPRIPDDYVQPLAVHESVEQELMSHGMPYDQAHVIATRAERTVAEQTLGLDWNKYSTDIAKLAPEIEAQKIMPDAWKDLNLHENPYDAIGHHTDKDIAGDLQQDEATPELSTPAAETPAPSGKEPDLNEIPDFLRRLPPRPASLGAAATPGDKAMYTSHLLDTWKNLKQNPIWFENPMRKIFSPQSISSETEEAGAASRQAHGRRMQADAQNAAGLVDAQRVINSAPAKDVTDYLLNFEKDSVPKGNLLTPIQADVKRVLDSEKTRIEGLPEGDRINFIDNYFPRSGLWGPEEDNMATLRNFLTAQGSTSPLKERKFPTIVDALQAGVKFNPDMLRPDGAPDMMKVLDKYLNQTGTYIESQNMLKDYIDRGVAHLYDITKEGDRIPPGEVRLEGRTYRGLPVYAPEDVATVYNNFWSPGVHGSAGYGDLYDTWMHGKNMMSALTLLGGGYHLSSIATESAIMNFSTGIEKMAAGDIAGGLKTMGKAPAAPYTAYKAGKQGLANYLDPKAHPEITPYVGALTDAGFTFASHQALMENPEFQYMNSPGNNFFSAFQRGSLKMEAQAAKQRVQEAVGDNVFKGAGQVGKEAFNLAGKAIQTAMFPLFQHYIPLVKNGVALEKMAAWADQNPNASYEDMVGAARKIADQTDNALGMMHQSNVFWNKVLKQAAQASMLSWGWNFGTVRAIGGGALKALRSPSSISPTSKDYDPRVSYVVAMPVLTTAMAAIYQLFKTGQMPTEPPNSLGEAFTAGTGGKAGGSNEPERAILPGYQKDVLGAWNNIFNPSGTGKISTEVYNKLAPAVRLGMETMTNEDWAGHPIWNPNHPMTQKIREYFQHVGQSLMPIAGQQVTQAREGTKIGPAERLLGVRPAPSFVQTPASTGEFMRGKNERDWAAKVKLDQRLGR